MSPEEREALASMTNRERKQAYYAKRKDKLTSLKKKTEQEPLSFKGRSAQRAAPKRTLRKGQFIREQDIQKPKKAG